MLAIEDAAFTGIKPDEKLLLLAHFDGNLTCHKGQVGSFTGALRYHDGKFDEGALVEVGTTNMVENPGFEQDLTGWTPAGAALIIARDTATKYDENNTVSVASMKMTGQDKAGDCYASASVAVTADTMYSAEVFVYSTQALTVKLQLAFEGGTPTSEDSGDVTLTADTWTRLEVENADSGTGNNLCRVKIWIVSQPPVYAVGSQFSKLDPTATAAVTDLSMSIIAGDIAVAAVSADPSAGSTYGMHMITTGATGVAGAALRIDDASAAPTYVPGTQFSKLTPAGTALVTDASLSITAGDLALCHTAGDPMSSGYAWHMVTTGATGVASADLRLDGVGSAPVFAPGSRFSFLTPTATAAVTDGAMSITTGDLVLCHTLSNPSSGGYAWHMVTTGATGVSSANLRLDGATSAPTFASGSRFSKITPTATAAVTDVAMGITTGDMAIASTTKNPVSSGYGWHLVSTGATGVANAALRLDGGPLTDILYADCAQLEQTTYATSYCDSFQGTGFSGSLGAETVRQATTLSFPTSGNIEAAEGAICFFFYPFQAGDDGMVHTLFDMAGGEELNRMHLEKNAADYLVLSVYDGSGGLKQLTSNSTVSWTVDTWHHLAFTWSSGTFAMYLDGFAVTATSSGSGTGIVGTLPTSMYLGSQYNGALQANAIFDDLIVKSLAASASEITTLAFSDYPHQGVTLAFRGISAGTGFATTHASVGTEVTIPHGLGSMPSFVDITEMGAGVVYLSTPPDATNIYVKGTASAVNFMFRAYAS